MQLPHPVQTYFDADQRSDGAALMTAFAPDGSCRMRVARTAAMTRSMPGGVMPSSNMRIKRHRSR